MAFRSPRAALLVGALLLTQAIPAPAVCPPGSCPCALTTRVYPVADLVIPVEGDPARTLENALIRTVESAVAPGSWAKNGGAGSAEYHPLTLSMVVLQTPEVHGRIAALLGDLRRQMDTQVALEMRFVSVSPETIKTLGLEETPSSGMPAVAMLDDTQVRMLLETAQADQTANIMQAPKMTMFNGQRAMIDISDKQAYVTGMETVATEGRRSFRPQVQNVSSGLKIHALPTVSADRRFVKLRLGLEMNRTDVPAPSLPLGCVIGAQAGAAPGVSSVILSQYLQQPRCNSIALEKTLVVADGATAMLSGWTQLREVRNEYGPPVLSQIPYLNRLFMNVGYSKVTEHLIVLVTPRVIVAEEKEEAINHAPAEEAVPEVPAEEEACEPVGTPTSSATTDGKAKEKEDASAAKDVPADPVATLYVKDRKFQLTYELDNVGTSNVKHVEVWWTKDTKTWERFSDDVKPTGKVVIAVKDEGTYGFRLNARSGAGLASPAPKSGDRPHTWVVVDTTPPVVKMEPVEVSRANDGEVVIKWSVKDEHLAASPATVRYAEKPEGPWKELVIRGQAEDTYRCAVGKLPPVCYFRIDAVDRSGNVGTAWTSEPVKVDLKVPVIRNVNVKPTPDH